MSKIPAAHSMNDALQLFLKSNLTGKVVRERGILVEGDATSKIYTSFDGSSWMEVDSKDIVARAPIPEFAKLNDSEEFVFLKTGSKIEHYKISVKSSHAGSAQSRCCRDTANKVCCNYHGSDGRDHTECISWDYCRAAAGSAEPRDNCCPAP